MSEYENRLRKAIQRAAKRGFENYTLMTSRGDCNCPHPVTYHPQDGHGYEDEKIWFDLDSEGKTAAYDDECEYTDPIDVLCRVFESLPEVEEREPISK